MFRSGSLLRGSRQAFTLVEILVVIIILAALALIALPSLLGQRDKAKDSQTRANITNTYKALKAEYSTGELYSTAVVTSAIANEPGINAIMVTGGSDFTYPSGKVEVSLLNSQTVVVAGKAVSGKTFLLAAKEQGSGAGLTRVVETNKFLTLAPVTNLVLNPSAETLTGLCCSTNASLDTSWSAFGRSSVRITNPSGGVAVGFGSNAVGFPVVAGQQYLLSYYVKVNSVTQTDGLSNQAIICRIQWYNGGGANVGTAGWLYNLSVTNGGRRVGTPDTAPVGATQGMVYCFSGGAVTAADVSIDGMMVTGGTTTFSYVDGDSPGGIWSGTPSGSTSTGYTGTSW